MKRIWDTNDLASYWSLSHQELELLSNKSRANRLGFSIQLKYFQIVGYFPKQPTDVPDTPVHYLADQLDMSMSDLDGYDWHGRTGKRHRTATLQFLNIKRVTKEDKKQVFEWLNYSIFPKNMDAKHCNEKVIEWFRDRRIEPPPEKYLERLIRSAITSFENKLLKAVYESISAVTRENMESLFSDDGKGLGFTTLKEDPRRIGLDSVVNEIKKVKLYK